MYTMYHGYLVIRISIEGDFWVKKILLVVLNAKHVYSALANIIKAIILTYLRFVGNISGV